MKKRIISIVCAIAILATMLSVGIVSSLADNADQVAINGFVAADWKGDWNEDGRTEPFLSVEDNSFRDKGNGIKNDPDESAGHKQLSITTANTYNLGDKWDITTSIPNRWVNRCHGEPYVIAVGELEARIYPAEQKRDATADKEEIPAKPTTVAIYKSKSDEPVKSADLAIDEWTNYSGTNGDVAFSYDNGTVTVKLTTAKDGEVTVTDTVEGLDFAAVKVTLKIRGNWANNGGVAFNGFTLTNVYNSEPESSEPESSEPESSEPSDVSSDTPAAPITDVDITDGINKTDWTGDTDNIYEITDGYGLLSSANSTAVKTITSANTYNLGNVWKSTVTLNTTYSNNMYGQPYVLKIGGLEAIVYNYKNADDKTGTAAENAAVELKKDGVSVKKVDLGDNVGSGDGKLTIGGLLELSYDNGTATVKYGETVITEDVGTMDFSNVSATLSIMGNWADKQVGVKAFTLKGETAMTPSEPESSEPESSEPESSEPEPALPTGIEGFKADDWKKVDETNETNLTFCGGGEITNAIRMDGAKNSVAYTAGKFNLSKNFYLSYVATMAFWNQESFSHHAVKIGDLTIDVDRSKDTVKNSGIAVIVVSKNGTELARSAEVSIPNIESAKNPTEAQQKYLDNVDEIYGKNKEGKSETNTHLAVYEAEYVGGVLIVKVDGKQVVRTKVDDLDLSAAEVQIDVGAGWQKLLMYDFVLFTDPAKDDVQPEPEPEKEKGATIETIVEGKFNATDWEGDVEAIRADDNAFYSNSGGKTIYTVKAYDLSGGFKFSSDLLMKNGYGNNAYGEHCSMYVGEEGTGLELRIQNVKGQALFTAHLLYKGEELATYDLINAPNGVYEIVYNDGKVTVNLDGNAIAWKLADSSTSTSVAIKDADFTNTKLGFRVAGNYHPTDRYWMNYSLSAISGGKGTGTGTGGTGDARNIVVPAVVLVISACAVAFVATRKKTNA